MSRLLAIALGGAVGSLLRYGLVLACQRWLGDWFAWGVLAANAIGCLAIGFLMRAAIRQTLPLSETAQIAIVVGLLGGLTTFSSFGYDTFVYWQAGAPRLAVANVAANLVVGLGMVALGQWIASVVLPVSVT